MSKTFFLCTKRSIKQNGLVIDNALVVSQIRTGENAISNEIEVTEKNRGVSIIGKRYVRETDEFEDVDEDKEETQLDRIEKTTSKLKSEIEQEAVDSYTLKLIELEVI